MRFLIKAIVLAALFVVGGFFVFVAAMPREDATTFSDAARRVGDLPKNEIGIVVFTGGGGKRIERALALYETGVADRVLISGTHPDVTKNDLWPTGRRATFDCCVDLGPRAQTTIGNAIEARDWANQRAYGAVYVVTSDFHLPRAVTEMRHAAPGLKIVGVPVSARIPQRRWYEDRQAWATLSAEYGKFLVSLIRSLN